MSNKKKINIVLPFVATKPIGGVKIMYQYANELAKRGHEVIIYHSVKRFEKTSFLPAIIRLQIYKIRKLQKPSWFQFHESIESKIVTELNDNNIKDGDIVFSTWWGNAFSINKLSPSKGKKFNLIQDYEIWKGDMELVHKSYTLPLIHMVIAKYLSDLVENISRQKPLYLPNAIDFNNFKVATIPEQREGATICMLYSEEPRKGTVFGLQALSDLKKIIPSLQVELFSIFKDPENLPEWIKFNYKPTDLMALYNRNAIFFSPSIGEGWALPPAEAMACGCAVVCTDIGGHHDYAINGKTALLVKVKDPANMTSTLLRMIDDETLRLRTSKNGTTYLLEKFNWQRSVSLLEEYFEK